MLVRLARPGCRCVGGRGVRGGGVRRAAAITSAGRRSWRSEWRLWAAHCSSPLASAVTPPSVWARRWSTSQPFDRDVAARGVLAVAVTDLDRPAQPAAERAHREAATTRSAPSKMNVCTWRGPGGARPGSGAITVPVASSQRCSTVASPARMHTNGSGRRPCLGDGLGAHGHLHQRRRHPLTHRADDPVALVGAVQVTLDASQRLTDGGAGDRVQRELARHGAVERGRQPQRPGPRWCGAVPVQFGVGTERPVAHRLHRLTPGQLRAVTDEHRFVTGEQLGATRRRVGEQFDMIRADLARRPRLRRDRHRRRRLTATQHPAGGAGSDAGGA